MSLLCWNYQGLGNPWTSLNLCKVVSEQAPNVCFLIETQLDKEGFDRLNGKLPYSNRIIIKKPDLGGGMALIWKNEVIIDLINFTANHILVKVKEEDGFEWWLTCFYGWPEVNQRHKSMELLGHLKSFMEGPWMCIGDFNVKVHLACKTLVNV